MNPNLLPDTAMNTPDTRARFAAIFGGLLKISVGLTVVVAVIYLALVAWLNHEISGQAISIVQAAGAPAEAERVFRGLLWLLVSFVAFNALIRLVLEAINPFVKPATVLPKLAVLIAVSFAGSLLPSTLRTLRGVDANDLPLRMERSDPDKAEWWSPDGKPVLFYSTEDDGSLEFWNRPAVTTPFTGSQSRPVNREIKRASLRDRAEKASRADEKRMQAETEKAAKERQAEEERRAAEVRKATEVRQFREAVAAKEAAQARAEAETARLRAEAENARANRLADEKEKLQRELAAKLESEREATVATARPRATAAPKDEALPWHKVTLYPGQHWQVRGATPKARIEIRSDGEGAFHAPDSGPPVRFSGGNSAFQSPATHFRLICGEPYPFTVSYRVVPR